MKYLVALFLGLVAVSNACETVCTQDYSPVCASNGMTFSNECVLKREACLSKSEITMVSEGVCPEISCPGVCPMIYSPVCGSDEHTYANFCDLLSAACQKGRIDSISVSHLGTCTLPCQTICTMNYEPVCGSDGRTYSNLCKLQQEACLTKSEIRMVFRGECQLAPSTDECGKMCPMIYEPVCGSNSHTYSNKCLLEVDACLSKSQITVASQGECLTAQDDCADFCTEIFDPVCGSDGVTYSNDCFLGREACLTKKTITLFARGECQEAEPCPQMCPDNFEPLCASNGKTYNNECEMLKDACLTKSLLSVSHSGNCETPFENCPQACTKEYRPVCGSDAVTYSNLCTLKVKACETKSNIVMSYEGPCRMPCPDFCPALYSPVCASNGRTFSNPCLLGIEACHTKTTLSVLHQGECVEQDCPQYCPMNFEPVCGSDGVTYGNLCSLNRQACLAKTQLSVASQGECPESCPEICPFIFSPVCGTNWQTYSNECTLKAEACRLKTDIKVAFNSECEQVGCNMRCSKEFKPVCGSDGVTYGNECMLLLSSCEKRRGISVLHLGECSSQDCEMNCIDSYEPVCGTDHTTYSNLCQFDSSNCKNLISNTMSIAIAHVGECTELNADTELTWSVLREFDSNNDGMISKEEFLTIASLVYPYNSQKNNEKVFKAIDANGDGFIDSEEAKELTSSTIHTANSEIKKNSATVAVVSTVLGLIVVGVAVAAMILYKKRRDSKFVNLQDVSTPYSPMGSS